MGEGGKGGRGEGDRVGGEGRERMRGCGREWREVIEKEGGKVTGRGEGGMGKGRRDDR